jgi:hypothetical protein
MKRLLLAIFCSFVLFGCLSSERLVVSQTTTTNTNTAANAITGAGSGDDGADCRAYWSAASPIAITAWKYSDNSLDLMLQNKDSQKVTLTDVQINHESVFSTKTTLNPNEAKTITIIMSTSCGNTGDSFELREITLAYDQGSMSGFTQKGTKPIVGTCS